MTRFLEVRLPAARLEEQRAFYGSALGLLDDGVGFQAGATRLVFERDREPRAPAHLAFNIPENRFGAGVAWVRERAEPLVVGGSVEVDFRAWNAHSVYFLDPDGNVLELIARHDLPNASDEPFGAASLLEVSEVGFPVPDVGHAVNWLAGQLGAELWDSAGDNFAAVGDEHGLFIVSREGRNWFPTTVPSSVCSIELTIDAPVGRLEWPELPYVLQGSRTA